MGRDNTGMEIDEVETKPVRKTQDRFWNEFKIAFTA